MAGQYYDQETGLHYNYFRYYDPSTGRYITSDPIGLQGGLNTYGYVDANPLSYVDPLGWHKGDKWFGYNNREFQRWFHKCWKQPGNPDAGKDEIAEAYKEWVDRGSPKNGKCDNTPPSAPEPVPIPECDKNCQKVAQTVTIGGVLAIVWVWVCGAVAF